MVLDLQNTGQKAKILHVPFVSLIFLSTYIMVYLYFSYSKTLWLLPLLTYICFYAGIYKSKHTYTKTHLS